MMEHLFTCAICERRVIDYADRNGRDRHIAPICNYCEDVYGDRGRPTSGAFMDRRNAARLSAISNALSCLAHNKQWSARYGRA